LERLSKLSLSLNPSSVGQDDTTERVEHLTQTTVFNFPSKNSLQSFGARLVKGAGDREGNIYDISHERRGYFNEGEIFHSERFIPFVGLAHRNPLP